jgi:ubiquinol-cytochrome c reductase iron-sulfur subunit
MRKGLVDVCRRLIIDSRQPGLSCARSVRLYAAAPYSPDFSHVRRDNGQSHAASPSGSTSDPRLFTYMMVGSAGVFGAVAAKSIVSDFVTSLSATGDTLAMAQAEVDISAIPEGKSVIVKWRGKPVFIRHRTASEIEEMQSVDVSQLRDPQSDAERTKKPEWLVMLGICTHLGCVPLADSGDFTSGWYCPCHGSHYDVAGRIRKGPAPFNLEIPKYDFIDDSTLLIG